MDSTAFWNVYLPIVIFIYSSEFIWILLIIIRHIHCMILLTSDSVITLSDMVLPKIPTKLNEFLIEKLCVPLAGNIYLPFLPLLILSSIDISCFCPFPGITLIGAPCWHLLPYLAPLAGINYLFWCPLAFLTLVGTSC